MTVKGKGIRFYSSKRDTNLDVYTGLRTLDEIRLEIKENGMIKNVYKRCLLDRDLFLIAFNKISKNNGPITPGVEMETLEGNSNKVVEEIIKSLKDHTFQFKPSRRQMIPKANGNSRPFCVPSPRDKVVQSVMVMVLESIYEPSVFLECSHGFRPNKNTHTALKYVNNWKGSEWFVIDPSIDH